MVAGKTIGDLHLDTDKKQQLNVYGGFTPAGSQQKSHFSQSIINKVLEQRGGPFLGRAAGDVADGTLPESTQDNLGAYTLQAGDTLESIAA